ncbi:MAG TPA: hypothetical protein VGC80_02505, partial [Acetobacteraceae bacterium]
MSAGSACVTCTTRQFGIGKTSFINHYILFNLKEFQIPETAHSTQSAEEPPDRGKISVAVTENRWSLWVP